METFTIQQRKLMEQEIDERTKQSEEELAKKLAIAAYWEASQA